MFHGVRWLSIVACTSLLGCTGNVGPAAGDSGVTLMDGAVLPGDSGARDSGARDSGTRDSGARDSGTRDSGARDTATADSATRDSGGGAPDPCDMSGPLAEPIPGCHPTPPPATGDPAADCVARINQFRHDCQCLPPLMRWTAGEACADMDAQYDSEHGEAHGGFRAGICDSGRAQNECPGWGSVRQTVTQCLQQMWDEGPGDFYGPPAHGHYINMSSTRYTRVACGFYDGPGGVWAVQNFR